MGPEGNRLDRLPGDGTRTEGLSLQDELQRLGGQPYPQALELGRQLAAVLARAHADGVFHPDLSPSQILLPRSGRLGADEPLHVVGLDTAGALDVGVGRGGTPPLDGRTDVFALGALLWEAFTGSSPLSETLGPQGGDSAKRALVAEQLPPGLAELLGHMTQPDPAQRPTMAQVASTLAEMGQASSAQTLDSGRPAAAGSPIAAAGFPVPQWDRYEILALLGRGGMGVVYKARDRRLGREVALKFILGGDPGMVSRFVQEARAQARIEHDNICKVYETGEVEGKPYIAMQLVDGLALDKAGRAMSLTQKAQVMADAARALHAAHELGIVHRDIKPSNVTIERET